MANLEKKALVVLDNNANIQPRADLDIVFSSADYDSGILNFQVLKNKRPLILGDPNVIGRIILKHSDNSVVVQKMEIDSGVNEFQFAYQVPNDILKRPGKVEAQITIAEKGNSNVVVAQRKFSFKIQDSLFSNVSAETKTTQIVEFQELQKVINDIVVDIQDAIQNSQDYVTKIEEAKTLALSEISDKLQQSLTDFISTSDEKENTITTKGDKYIQDITAGGEDVNKAIKDFQDFMIDKDIVLSSETENWQKQKLTDDNGNQITNFNEDYPMTSENLLSAKTGFYYNLSYENAPSGSTGYVFIQENGGGSKKIYYSSYNKNDLYIKTYHSSVGWIEWKEIVTLDEDEEVVSKNDLDQILSDFKQEIKKEQENKHKVLFDGNVSGVDETIELEDNIYDYNHIVISGEYPGGRYNEIHLLNNDDDIVINKENLADSNGKGPIVYELIIKIENDKKLKLDNETINNVNDGTHNNKETHIEVKRIEGFKV